MKRKGSKGEKVRRSEVKKVRKSEGLRSVRHNASADKKGRKQESELGVNFQLTFRHSMQYTVIQ